MLFVDHRQMFQQACLSSGICGTGAVGLLCLYQSNYEKGDRRIGIRTPHH